MSNLCIATAMERCQIRLLFPNRPASADGDLRLTIDEHRSIYDDGLRMAVREIVPEHAAHWPESFDVGLRTARDARGQTRFHSVNVPEDRLKAFAKSLLDKFPEDGALGKPFFMIEVRGTKTGFTFQMDDDNDRRIVLEKYIEPLDLRMQEKDNLDNWYVDVAVELSRSGHVVQWRTDAHASILKHACQESMDLERARRTVERSSKYYRDISGLLYDLSGFRFSPTQPIDGVSHFNVYTTDKTPIYQLHRGIFRVRGADDLFPKKIQGLYKDIEEESAQITACAGFGSAGQDGTARLEVRVKFNSALNAIPQLSDRDVEGMIVVYPNAVWW